MRLWRGKVLGISGKNNISFQWYGNAPLPEAHRPFLPGWVDKRDNKGYYALRKLHFSHPPWTGADTGTEIGTDNIAIKGTSVLGSDNRISRRHREEIERMTGERIAWM